MATASSSMNLVAKRYAAAFLDMAAEEKLVDKVEKDFYELTAMVAGSEDLQSMLRSPRINRQQQKDAILALAQKAGFQKLTCNFLGVIADNRRLPILWQVITAFSEELKRRRGVAEAKVQTAQALTPAQTKALQEALGKAMGTGVALDVEVDESLLGGMVVTVGSRMFDDSVKRKLERLQRAMGAGGKAA